MKISCSGAFAVLVLLPAAARAQGNVWIVDASDGGGIWDIQTAVEAAQDGDTILIKTGAYSSFSVVNKTLTVVADTNATVTVYGGIQVRSLESNRCLVLANLDVHGQFHSLAWQANAVHLTSNLGSVRIQNCSLIGQFSSSPFPPSSPGVRVEASPDVAFENCWIQGGFLNAISPSPSGLVASGSMIAIYDSQVVGRQGYGSCYPPSPHYDGGDGGVGATISDTFLFGSGDFIRGGHGGDAPGLPCAPGNGGNGGNGLTLNGSNSHVALLDAQVVGGQAGEGICGLGCGHDGHDGARWTVAAGSSLSAISGSKRVLTAAGVVRELTPVPLTFLGQPGDEVGVFIGTKTEFEYVRALSGVKLVAAEQGALYAMWLGFADPITGTLTTSLAFPDLGPGVQSKPIYLQAIARTPQGVRILGSSITVVVLDQAF